MGGIIFIFITACACCLHYKFCIFAYANKKLYHDTTDRNNTETEAARLSSDH